VLRAHIKDQWCTLEFASQLWQFFRAIISGTLKQRNMLGNKTNAIMEAIDERVDEFLTTALQLDTFTLRMEFE